MKKLFGWAIIPLILLTAACTYSYNDRELRDSIKDLYAKLTALESKVQGLNQDISSLQTLVTAIQNRVTVVNVEKKENGYTVLLSDNTIITIDNSIYEAPDVPIIGVKLDEDGIYYWTITKGGITEWLVNEKGEKIKVDSKKPNPIISVDEEGLWIISYDGGKTHEYIVDANGNPISAISSGTTEPIFTSVSEDSDQVYFELADGTILVVPKAKDFYLVVRELPVVVEFDLGEKRIFETESHGVDEVVTTTPQGWNCTFDEGLLEITAPNTKDGVDNEGEIALLYYGEQGKAGAVKLKVALKTDYTGITEDDNFTVNIIEITSNSIHAQINGKDPSMEYYVYPFDPAKSDEQCIEQMKRRYKADVYDGPEYVDYFHKGTYEYKYSHLIESEEYTLGVIGVSYDLNAKTIEVLTPLMKVPFKTSASANFNSVYRFELSNKSWYGIDVKVHPSDYEPYLFTVVKKETFDAAYNEKDFAQEYIDNKYLYPYYDELNYDHTLNWAHFTNIGDKNFSLPGFIKREPLYTSEDLYPLEPATDYYVIAFGCNKRGELSSNKVSKRSFRTAPFRATEDCTFEIKATANRQDLTIKVTPSNPNVTYITFIDERDHYSNNFYSPLQYAAYDLYWRKQLLKDGQSISDSKEFYKGESTYTVENLKASYAYIVFAYGCDSNGNITTEPEIIKIITESSGT